MQRTPSRFRIPATALACGVALAACTGSRQVATKGPEFSLTRYVDPYIGTGFHGHVFWGANVPFGAVQLGPVNLSEGWDWCAGYHYSDSTIVGFSHTHLSGTGIGDLGDVAVMPTTGAVRVRKGTLKHPDRGFVSRFSHQQEQARPGYYAVRLKRYDIKAELTATERVGFHQYTFPKSAAAHLIFGIRHRRLVHCPDGAEDGQNGRLRLLQPAR